VKIDRLILVYIFKKNPSWLCFWQHYRQDYPTTSSIINKLNYQPTNFTKEIHTGFPAFTCSQ
jgi:hypothetical protein